VIEVARELLSAVAQLPQVRKRDSLGCSSLFANLLKQYRGYANLVAVEPSGKVFWSGQPLPWPVNFADRNWFRRVVESREALKAGYEKLQTLKEINQSILSSLDLKTILKTTG